MRGMASLLLLALATPAFAASAPPALPPPVPPPPPQNCTAAEHRQFDFLVGEWEVRQTGKLEQMHGVDRIESINFGCGLRETWLPFTSINGASLTSYDPQDKAWHQSWIDAANSRMEFRGGQQDGRMVLTGQWRGFDGSGLMRMTWWPAGEGRLRKTGEFSRDEGKSWSVVFDYTYLPRPR